MKKVIILSDSHRNTAPMMAAIAKEQPDYIWHLGDHIRDTDLIRRTYPQLPLVAVPGNCDYDPAPDVRTFTLEGHKIMLCHGHQYGVKQSPNAIAYAAREAGADLVCFGHTHHRFLEDSQRPVLFNPGSIGQPPYAGCYSYGILLIDPDTLQLLHKDMDDAMN